VVGKVVKLLKFGDCICKGAQFLAAIILANVCRAFVGHRGLQRGPPVSYAPALPLRATANKCQIWNGQEATSAAWAKATPRLLTCSMSSLRAVVCAWRSSQRSAQLKQLSGSVGLCLLGAHLNESKAILMQVACPRGFEHKLPSQMM
jgi:hypothetical protein